MFNLICINEKSKLVVVFIFIANLNDCFNNKKIAKLFNYKKNDYVIDLIFDIKLLYKPLYAFSKKKLNVFQKYLKINKKSKKICCFINFAKTFIMFVLKKIKIFVCV